MVTVVNFLAVAFITTFSKDCGTDGFSMTEGSGLLENAEVQWSQHYLHHKEYDLGQHFEKIIYCINITLYGGRLEPRACSGDR